jgi:hypothetical protein
VLNPENPPLSGLDQPRLDFKGATSSFISPALAVTESADTNPGNEAGVSAVKSVTRVLGAFDLQRFWPKSDLFAEYLGGGAFYSTGDNTVRQLHALGLLGVTRWRTGQLTVRDAFSYLPEGSFSIGAYGGAPGLGLAQGGSGLGMPGGGVPGTHIFGNGSFSSVGLVPRLANTSIVDAVQSLTPRSALTVAGGYSFAHFLEDQEDLINSQQITVQGGYSYMLGRRDQAAIVYAFQEFHFPVNEGGQVDTNVINLRWSHTITGRLNLEVGAGPQHLSIYQPANAPFPSSEDKRWNVSGRGVLRYRFNTSFVSLSYEKYTSAGSGFFAGADTQVARLSLSRPLSRTWQLYGDIGFSHNKRLQQQLSGGTPGDTFNDGFVGAIVRKQIGRDFGAFAAYRFSALSFDSSFCGNGEPCNRISHRHVGSIGVDWHPRPIRIE